MAGVSVGRGNRLWESSVLLVLVLATAFAILLAVDKLAFLSFYQIPVLVAAYLLGRRQGVLVAIAAVLMVSIYALIHPALFMPVPNRGPGVAIFLWGAFTILAAYLVGTLYDAKAAAARDLSEAYEGLVDILTELVDAVDTRTDSRSVRVANLAARIGMAMELEVSAIEDLRVAGLLHDVHKVGVSLDVLRKAAHAEGSSGTARRGSSSGGLLRNVVPLVELYHEHYDGGGPLGMSGDAIPLGARVLAVANEYVQDVVREPFGKGMSSTEALMAIEQESGKSFDPAVITGLIAVAESTDLVA